MKVNIVCIHKQNQRKQNGKGGICPPAPTLQNFAEPEAKPIKIPFITKNLEEKDGQRQLLYYVSLIRACNKVLDKLVYIGKKFVFLKKNLGI